MEINYSSRDVLLANWAPGHDTSPCDDRASENSLSLSRVTSAVLDRFPKALRERAINMAREESLARSLTRDTTSYLCYLLFIATLGPLQFGFHLVGIFYKLQQMRKIKLTLARLSSTLRKRSSRVLKSLSCRPVCAPAFRNVSQ